MTITPAQRRHRAQSRHADRDYRSDRANSWQRQARDYTTSRSYPGRENCACSGTIDRWKLEWSANSDQQPNAHQARSRHQSQGSGDQVSRHRCAGKLIRTESSKSYVFFIEVITKGRVDKGGRCPDGTITVARQGDNLAVGWFGNIKDNLVVAYGTLAKR
jgi:hypothetical protein